VGEIPQDLLLGINEELRVLIYSKTKMMLRQRIKAETFLLSTKKRNKKGEES
jgi:hypothetical protein